ncbi:MAG: T9SS type A sorting domain-containing protein [Flavobacteriales bacterium]|nr:T9SS type A sorting domain-containing protein [Flavobacteriales bacterium]
MEYNFQYKAYEIEQFEVEALRGDLSTPVELTLERSMISNATMEVSVYPNPFNDRTNVNILLQEDARISMKLEDVSGRLIKKIPAKVFSKGRSLYVLEQAGLPPGVYLLHVTSEDNSYIQKLIISE